METLATERRRFVPALQRVPSFVWVIVFLGTLVGAAVALYCRRAPYVSVPDVRSPWTHTFQDRLHTVADGRLSIHIVGRIDGEAVVRTPVGHFALHAGTVDVALYEDDCWETEWKVSYEPETVAGGNLSVRVELGSNAEKMNILDTVPVLYNGSWKAWYPGRRHIYSEGRWADGRKAGKWTYWDRDGKVMRVENWPERSGDRAGTVP